MKLLAVLLVLFSAQSFDLKDKITKDRTLIGPGIGANSILLNETIHQLRKKIPKDITVVSSRFPQELFRDIFNAPCNLRIGYTSIYYYNKDTVLFIMEHKVTGIGITNKDRVTSDLVAINKGANHFVFNYGNEGLSVIKRGKHKIYIYKAKGIAIIDDKDDDAIDMVLVFKPFPGQ